MVKLFQTWSAVLDDQNVSPINTNISINQPISTRILYFHLHHNLGVIFVPLTYLKSQSPKVFNK